MRVKDKAVARMIEILGRHLYAQEDVLRQIAEQIFHGVVEPAVEEERQEWILFSKSAPGRPDGGGFDA